MKNSEDLEKILQKKKFKTFWHCFEFLTTASYQPMEAFSISLKHYGENKIFDNVAFIRPNKGLQVIISQRDMGNFRGRPQLFVGIITEANSHLSQIYRVYQKWFYENKIDVQQDVESTCEIIEICEITPFIRAYLFELIIKHYEIDIKKIKGLEFQDTIERRLDIVGDGDIMIEGVDDGPYIGDIVPNRNPFGSEDIQIALDDLRDNIRQLNPNNPRQG